MRRFFVERLAGNEKMVLITDKGLHHLKDVPRLKNGDGVIVFDGDGNYNTKDYRAWRFKDYTIYCLTR